MAVFASEKIRIDLVAPVVLALLVVLRIITINLLTNSLAQKNGLPGFGVFEFTKLGAILAVVGIAYLMLVGRWLLPKQAETLLS